MKTHQDNTSTLTALLRASNSVDTLETNSLCCAAAGIIAPSSATTEALIPHEKLRGAALADATLNAQKRPLAQPVLGYTHVTNALDDAPEAKPGQRYWPADLTNVRPDEWAVMSPKHVAEFAGVTEVWMLLEAAQKRIAELEQVNTNLRESAVALCIDSDVLNEQLMELLLEREKSTTQLATDTLLIEWLNQKGTYWDVSEFSQVSFPHTPHSLGFKHLRDALVEAYQQDQSRLSGGAA